MLRPAQTVSIVIFLNGKMPARSIAAFPATLNPVRPMHSRFHRLVCLTTIALFFVFSGCNSKQDHKPYTADSSESTADISTDSAKSGSAIADSIEDQSIRIAPALPDNSMPNSTDELFRYLAQQSFLQSNASDPADLLRIQLDKLNASTKLLKGKLNDDQRFSAVQTKLDALLRLTSLGNSGSRQEFLAFVTGLENDSNPRIQQTAAVSQVVGELNDRLSKKDQNIDSVIEQASAVARRFPESADVCIELYNTIELVAKSGSRDQVIRMLESLAGVYQNNVDPRIISVVAIMNTRIELAALNLDVIFNRIRERQPDAILELESRLETLLAGDSITLQTLERVNRSASWLEMEQRFDSADKVNQVLLGAVESVKDARLQSQMRDMCIRRQVRIDLLGQLITDELPLADGGKFDRSKIAGQNTITVFWSPSEPASVNLIKQLAELRDKQTTPHWELLGVCITRNPDVIRTLFGGTIPAWPNITITDEAASLADSFGVLYIPHVMLLDDQHRFVSTTFPLTRLTEQLEKWSGNTDAQ